MGKDVEVFGELQGCKQFSIAVTLAVSKKLAGDEAGMFEEI